jgi:uncharacterized protein (TIGR02246 family)
MRNILTVLLIAFTTSCAMQPKESEAVIAARAKDQVVAATAAWAAAFNSRDPSRITLLYDLNAVFWGTTAKTLATTPAAIAEYFKDMPTTPNLRVALGEQNIRVFGDMAINTGSYTFSFPKGEIPARYTFVFRFHDGRWWIVEHHSSRVP